MTLYSTAILLYWCPVKTGGTILANLTGSFFFSVYVLWLKINGTIEKFQQVFSVFFAISVKSG